MPSCEKSVLPPSNEELNTSCFCQTLDRASLASSFTHQLGDNADTVVGSQAWNQYFSDVPVFLSRANLDQMVQIVAALEQAVDLPAYREQVRERAGGYSATRNGPAGAFMGYDFHLTPAGPRLIEINTNAGGAFLNAPIARAQQSCCGATVQARHAEEFDAAVAAMFVSEWTAQRGGGRPRTIAIVDDAPEQQYLYPEFQLAKHLLEKHGFKAYILDPRDLTHTANGLTYKDVPIDLVYNRLVDFDLTGLGHEELLAAWRANTSVITPNPAVHALHADKRNLIALCDAPLLESWGLSSEFAKLLEQAIPHTELVLPQSAEEVWQSRKALFFKPVAGHGSRGVYRGSKLTRGTFEKIVADAYVAQTYAPPSERLIRADGEFHPMKVDVRLYTYRGDVLLTAARLYQGQTTNFRTPGGGFAPLLIV